MLSNPTKNLQTRQRQHRRQNSTPTAFEPLKASNLRNLQRHAAHRRGMSLDQQQRRQSPTQDANVSTTNNQGYQATQQQILREAQQHRPAHPGHRSINRNEETSLPSPQATPHRQSFDSEYRSSSAIRGSNFTYPEPINTNTPFELTDFRSSTSSDYSLYSSDGAMTPSAFLDFSAALDNECGLSSGYASKRSSFGRRISGGIADRISQFESLALQSPIYQRPFTPPNQNARSMTQPLLCCVG